MKLIIVRHAETIENRDKIVQGHKPGKLSPLGLLQVEKLTKRLLKEKIDVIYSSDLERCKETIEPFLKITNVPIHYTELLRERSKGIFDGKTQKEHSDWMDKNPGKFPEGSETFEDTQRRISQFLKEIFQKEKGKNVLIITHGGIKPYIVMQITNKHEDNERDRLSKLNANTAITIIEIDDKGNHKINLLYSVDHLEDLK